MHLRTAFCPISRRDALSLFLARGAAALAALGEGLDGLAAAQAPAHHPLVRLAHEADQLDHADEAEPDAQAHQAAHVGHEAASKGSLSQFGVRFGEVHLSTYKTIYRDARYFPGHS